MKNTFTNSTVLDLLSNAANRTPSKTYCKSAQHEFTYQQFVSACVKLSNEISEKNIKNELNIDNYTEPFIRTYESDCIDDKSNYNSEGIFELTKTFSDYPDRELFFTFSHHNHDDFETDYFKYDSDLDSEDRDESTTTSNDLGMYLSLIHI